MKAWWNLTQEEQITRSKHCFVGSIIIAIVCVIFFIVTEYSAHALVERCTATTMGEVISVHSASRYNPQSTLSAHYKINGVQYSTEGHYKSKYSAFDTLSKKPVIVHYDPNDPAVSYAADAPQTTFGWIWAITGIIFGIGSPLFLLQAKQIREHGAVMQKNPFKSDSDE